MTPYPSEPTPTRRYGAVDVHYLPDGRARAALIVCPTAAFGEVVEQRTVMVDDVAEYRPGNFYERELPPLRTLLTSADLEPLDLLVVDSYVTLSPDGHPGLGAYVHTEKLAPVVVGVAKKHFHSATHAIEVVRGESKRPLYVTSAGIPVEVAAEMVREMSGAARIPTALRLVDRLARNG